MSEDRTKLNSKWIPSLTEMVFVSVLAWLFLSGQGMALLSDGDTGWHIRTGEYILQNHSMPRQDLFSFSRAGQPWFAWEWLSEVIFAGLHKAGGLAGVVLLSGVVIAATSAVVFRYMIWQGSDMLVAVVLMLVAGSASTVHWLARPHLFSYLFLAVAIWVLEADRRRPTQWVFALAGLSVLWTNLHGGFVALLVTLGIYLGGNIVETLWAPAGERSWGRAKRYGILLGLALAATLVNPYTWRLHQHIFSYLRSDFILDHVQEFRSPNFRGEGMRYFEVLLFAGLAAAPALVRRRDVTSALMLVFWSHAALLSARHVLLYVVVAAPLAAREASAWWARAGQSRVSWIRTLHEIGQDYGTGGVAFSARAVGWLAPAFVVMTAGTLFAGRHSDRLRSEFSKEQFPVAACQAAAGQLAGHKIFTSDQWGDYLIYRYYPKLKVFIDGRSDFYGPELGQEYLRAMNSHHQWGEIFDRYGFDLALLPAEWPLATTIKAHPNWKVKYDDGKALLLERVAGSSEAAAAPATGHAAGGRS
ncbi:MAG: hypothetical protein HY238_09325 [Acidobacteria bacterium]|nr:hypothetical protein [Acidobacteriota bacterium]